MNPQDLQKLQEGMAAYGRIPAFFFIHYQLVAIFVAVWFLAYVVTLWDCLFTRSGLDRLTWLVAVIFIPVFG
jgi:hypothetical protein